ncbi:MAG: MBL fold metallo-hydrolase [Fusobacterium sp. JB019]|nr:MBL fold metallo-hydrolase [Fusobacterium sp. JB020]MDP0505954.1 MBL fold metallo-hydrolase [Fusobacterium sp. JB019]
MDTKETFKVTQIEKNTYRIWELGGNYLTLLLGKKKAMLIDTGFGFYNSKEIIEKITDLPLIVVNSHGHLDHTGGNYLYDEIYLHHDDLKTYSHYQKEKGLMIDTMKKRFDKLKKDYVWPENFSKDEYVSQKTKKFIFMKDVEKFDLGDRIIEFTKVPGHTLGQMVAFDYNTGILFSSDAVASNLWIYYDEGVSLIDYCENIEKLKKYPIKYILSGHLDTKFPRRIIDALQATIKARSAAKSRVFIHPRNKHKALLFKYNTENIKNFEKIDKIQNMNLIYAPSLSTD